MTGRLGQAAMHQTVPSWPERTRSVSQETVSQTLIILSSAPKTNHLLFVSKAAHFTDQLWGYVVAKFSQVPTR